MKMRCPCCYSEFGLEQMLADDAAREVMGLISQLPKGSARLLVQYTGLFRPRKQALSWDRAHKLISEASTLAKPATLNTALTQTIDAMRAKQKSGEWTPLKNHNYLKQVIQSLPEVQPEPVYPAPPVQAAPVPPVSNEPPRYVTEEHKAHRSPEVRAQAARSLSQIMAGINGKQSGDKSNDTANGSAQA